MLSKDAQLLKSNGLATAAKPFEFRHHSLTAFSPLRPSRRVPCDSADPKCQSQLRKWNHQRRRYPSTCIPGGAGDKSVTDLDDPFAMLQELITDGSLIKEAVRRLQLGLTPKLAMAANKNNNCYYDSETDGEDLDECSVSGEDHIVLDHGAAAAVVDALEAAE